MKGQDELLKVIKEIARGNYSNDIMELTNPEYPEKIREIAEAVGMMMVKIEAREFKLEAMNLQLKDNILKTISSIANALAARDLYTNGHGYRVAMYGERLAKRLGLPHEEVEDIKHAGILHDIGKIGFSDKVFANEDIQPSEEILEEIKQHPGKGFEILKDLDFLGNAIEYILYHHERMDGKGYPMGKTAQDIPIGARILSVADCFDAMTTDRPYQKGKSPEEAFSILKRLSNSSLDPAIVEAFILEIQEGGMAPHEG